MFQTVRTRLLITYMAVVFVVLFTQSLIMTLIYSERSLIMTRNDIKQETQVIATMVSKDYMMEGYISETSVVTLSVIAKKYGITLWIMDRFNNVIMTQAAGINIPSLEEQKKEFVEDFLRPYSTQVFSGKELEVIEKRGGLFRTPTMLFGSPIIVQDQVMGVVFSQRLAQPNEFLRATNSLSLIYSCGVFIVATLLICWLAYTISAPLREMRKMTESIARGEFNYRIKSMRGDEIGQLAQGFNDMAEKLHRQDLLRTGFVANVSHELRSPMTSVQGFAQAMLDGTIPVEERDKYLKIIMDETTRLSKLVRELLDLSKIDAGEFPLSFTVFDINEMIRRVVIRYLNLLEEKNINLEVNLGEEYAYVRADADRIEQVIINLLDNAIKFTPEQGSISFITHQTTDKVLITISDSGEGIPETDLPYIFERFYKVDKSHTDKKGTGLGLSIVKLIINQHGEDITVKSRYGKGTAFSFPLPKGSKE